MAANKKADKNTEINTGVPSFAEIVGQEQIKELLKNTLTHNQVSHAYIIHGERSSGKEYIARLFAMALQCEKRNSDPAAVTEPCGECHSCRQFLSNNHPDIMRVQHEKPNTIGVEDIRRQVNEDVIIKPYSDPYKIYIINEGEKMSPSAQNALLKTLEEPPAYAVIMILTTNIDLLLPTIVSRCVVLHMKPAPDEEVRKYLIEKLKVPDYKADVCVAFARGNVGKAKALATSEEFDNIKAEVVSLLKYIAEMNIGEMVQAVKKIEEYELNIHDYLDLFTVWYRDVLLFKATNDANHLIFREEIQYIRKVADKSSYEGIETIIEAIGNAKSRLNANVNFELTMELLLLTIKEN